MEDIEVEGLVVRETRTGEADKLVTLFTDRLGRITVSGKGASSMKNKFASSTQLFAYSNFQLRKKGSFYYIHDASYREGFINIRYDLEKLSLATYVCDVACELAQEEAEDSELLSLTLNTLYAIANRDTPLSQIKAAFEFRAAVTEGYMPDLSECGGCGCEITGESVIDVMNGHILCKKCRVLSESDPTFNPEEESRIFIRLSPAVLSALRYIEEAPPKRFISFSLEEADLSLFSVVCERYLLNHIEHGFASLEYYKKIRQPG